MLHDVKQLLGITDETQDKKLTVILESVQSRLCILLGGTEVPAKLEYIVTEVAVARFNRIGSEGMTAHNVEGESVSFTDDEFSIYMKDIEAYLDEQQETKRGRVRFL